MGARSDIDVLENSLRQRGALLDILLIDRASGRNIIWATDSYVTTGKRNDPFLPTKQIKPELVTGVYGKLIQPRAAKSREEQHRRTKDKAEVFTPLSIVEKINISVDWAGEIKVPNEKNWQQYVQALMLEITCGEAPFIVSRYNPMSSTGKLKKIERRVGFLDRKLREVSRYCNTHKDWVKWAKEAYKASYGYEWQGDNVLIARENLLYSFIDYYRAKFNRRPALKLQEEIAEIISWNIWQMDGLKFVRPLSCGWSSTNSSYVARGQLTLIAAEKPKKPTMDCDGCRTGDKFAHSGRYALVKDWQLDKTLRFVDIPI